MIWDLQSESDIFSKMFVEINVHKKKTIVKNKQKNNVYFRIICSLTIALHDKKVSNSITSDLISKF